MKSAIEQRQDLEKTRQYVYNLHHSAYMFFVVGWKLKLFGSRWKPPFGGTYHADKLVQSFLWGKYDALQPQRGTRSLTDSDISTLSVGAHKNSTT